MRSGWHVRLVLMAALLVPAVPAWPDEDRTDEDQTDEGQAGEVEEGAQMLSEGARRLLGGLLGEIEPRLRALGEALRAGREPGWPLEDPGAYEAPELLPNGDIIIRRRRPDGPGPYRGDEIEI